MTSDARKNRFPSKKSVAYAEQRALGASTEQAAEAAGYARPAQAEAIVQASPALLEYQAGIRERYRGQIADTGLTVLHAIAKHLAEKPSESFLITMLERFNGLILGGSAPTPGTVGPNVQVNVESSNGAEIAARLETLHAAILRREPASADRSSEAALDADSL